MTIEINIFNTDGIKTDFKVVSCIEAALVTAFGPIVYIEKLKRKEFLSAKEVEELYDIPESSLRTMRSRNAGPKYYQTEKGCPVRYTHNDIKDYLKSIWRGGGNVLPA